MPTKKTPEYPTGAVLGQIREIFPHLPQSEVVACLDQGCEITVASWKGDSLESVVMKMNDELASGGGLRWRIYAKPLGVEFSEQTLYWKNI